jgi:protein-S-isoprenylcysteine O-methyltransferase Ste14
MAVGGERIIRRVSAGYFLFLAVATAVWWGALVAYPASRAAFAPAGDERALLRLWLADLVGIVAASALAGFATWRGEARSSGTAWFAAGCCTYSALQCLVASVESETAWIGTLLMLAAAAGSVVAAMLSRGTLPLIFREADEAGPAWNLAKTLTQIGVFWTTFLVLIPGAVVRIEGALGLHRFTLPYQRELGGVGFGLLSLLGLWSALSIVLHGAGTPLPADAPRRFVVRGPYRWVRNPMAIGGLGQGYMVGLMLGSPCVFLYATLGVLVWNYGARPPEEHDLETRFGERYRRYRNEVRCWVPRARPYTDDA